jgi:hypothetical protein
MVDRCLRNKVAYARSITYPLQPPSPQYAKLIYSLKRAGRWRNKVASARTRIITSIVNIAYSGEGRGNLSLGPHVSMLLYFANTGIRLVAFLSCNHFLDHHRRRIRVRGGLTCLLAHMCLCYFISQTPVNKLW